MDLKFSDNVLEELEEMKKQCIASLDNVKDVDAGNVDEVLAQAVAMEQKTDNMRDKYFKKQMQRLKKGNASRRAGSYFPKSSRTSSEWEIMCSISPRNIGAWNKGSVMIRG